MEEFLKFLKTKFFLTKVIPMLFFVIPCLVEIYKIVSGMYKPAALEFTLFAIAAILVLNLFFRKNWLNRVIGAICVLSFFFLIFSVLSEYFEYSNLLAFEALRLLSVGLLLCLTGISMGIVLMVPIKSAKQ